MQMWPIVTEFNLSGILFTTVREKCLLGFRIRSEPGYSPNVGNLLCLQFHFTSHAALKESSKY